MGGMLRTRATRANDSWHRARRTSWSTTASEGLCADVHEGVLRGFEERADEEEVQWARTMPERIFGIVWIF